MKADQISDLMLEQYLLRELPGDSVLVIERLLEESALLRERLAQLEESNRSIGEQYPSCEMAGRIEQKYNRQKKSMADLKRKMEFPSLKYIFTAAVGACAIVAFFVLAPLEQTSDYVKWFRSYETTRIKGDESNIYIYRKKGDAVEALKNGSRAREHDLLQIAYRAHRDTHGIIFSIDGRGTVTLQYPDGELSSTEIVRSKKTSLSSSYELDDAPGFERFFFITARHPIDAKNILAQARTLAADPGKARDTGLELDKSLQQTSFLLIKE